MFYLEPFVLVPDLAGVLDHQPHVGVHHSGALGPLADVWALGRRAHGGPHHPQVQGDTLIGLEGSQGHQHPLVNLIDLKECKGVKILTNLRLMLVTTFVSHRNRV